MGSAQSDTLVLFGFVKKHLKNKMKPTNSIQFDNRELLKIINKN
jgi:hypothetical protein